MKKVYLVVAILLAASLACRQASSTAEPAEPTATTASMAETPAEDTAARLAQLGGEACPDSDFTCVTIEVPFDHSNPDGRTLGVVFGVLPASGERKGMFVTANGGPGASGLQVADSYTAAFDPAITEHFDIVFFDQRGIGLSGGLQCTNAAGAFYRADWDTSTPEGEDALSEAARTFSAACVAEMNNPEYLPYLGTEQAVEDLEAFRAAMGDDTFWLYGESYGTQFAQTYAAAHGDHLAGLILDGTVDLTLTGFDFYAQQASAFNDVLVMTLEACNADELCAAAMGDDAVTLYDVLASHLREEPQPFEFPRPSGTPASRSFSFSDLETAAAGYMYSEAERTIFLRALASYVRDGTPVPMARVLYDSLGLDPETEQPVPDPSYSDAMYYAVECQDYYFPGDTPDARAEAYLRAGDVTDDSLPRFSSIFYGDLPCTYWPDAQSDDSRPAPLSAEGIPTLVLGGTADPATPYQNGVDVFERLADGYHVTETGGPHVIFGWGVSCVDDLVAAFLVDDTLPDRSSTCEGVVADAFIPPAPRSAADFADPLDALVSVDDEIYYLPEYYYWDLETPTTVGCPFGGTLTFEPSDVGEALTFTGCAFSDGFVMTGDGSYDYDAGTFTIDVSVTGLATGTLTYTRDAGYNLAVTGDYDGQPVDLSE